MEEEDEEDSDEEDGENDGDEPKSKTKSRKRKLKTKSKGLSQEEKAMMEAVEKQIKDYSPKTFDSKEAMLKGLESLGAVHIKTSQELQDPWEGPVPLKWLTDDQKQVRLCLCSCSGLCLAPVSMTLTNMCL